MSQAPTDLLYARETHEWVRPEADGVFTVGVTDHAQDALGDLVYVELPEVGQIVSAGDALVVLESMKTASDVFAPVTGTIVAINPVLEADPETVNASPYDRGWLFRIQSPAADLSVLTDAATYLARVDA